MRGLTRIVLVFTVILTIAAGSSFALDQTNKTAKAGDDLQPSYIASDTGTDNLACYGRGKGIRDRDRRRDGSCRGW